MSETKDPAIKLFGKTIQLLLPDDAVVSRANEQPQQQLCSSEHTKKSSEGLTTTQKEDACSRPSADSSIDLSTSSGINNDDPKTPTPDKEASLKSTSKKEHPTEKPNSDGKPHKPDKILPCPRCNSMDTKFCYYNNYNVNQPRHFCKKCQRYWTDGGTMRNMPVGSGRRKNKSSSLASHYRHIVTSDALQGPHYLHPLMESNGSLLMFSSDVPLCESMNSSLNLSDKSNKKEDHPILSSSSASDSTEKVGNCDLRNFQGYPLQVPCFPAPSWPYPRNSAQYRHPMAAPTNLGPSGFPVYVYPPPQYWGCSVPGPWSIPLATPPPNQFAPTSPLGKHSRDGTLLSLSSRSVNEEFLKEKDSESGILVPKTLRINVPNEAAKSSLLSTSEIIKDENCNSTSGGNLFKAFQSKVDEKRNEVAEKSLVTLQANPAALSRSLNFHETS